ncbi:MAG TPA: hypothetical protein VMT64_14155 [Candidatus Binataceae bacterium]|nr:hypothetical protein [Candidatus Binataceae bacterium]
MVGIRDTPSDYDERIYGTIKWRRPSGRRRCLDGLCADLKNTKRSQKTRMDAQFSLFAKPNKATESHRRLYRQAVVSTFDTFMKTASSRACLIQPRLA